MPLKRLALILLISILTTACKKTIHEDEVTYIEKSDFKIETLTGENLEFDSLLRPDKIFFNNDKLYIIDGGHPTFSVSIYNLSNRQIEGRYIRKGNGPDEILHIQNLQFIGDSLVAFDNRKKRLLFFNKVNLVNEPKRLKEIKIDNTDVKSPLIKNSKNIIDFGLLGTHRINIYNTNGKLIEKVGYMPKMKGFELTKGVTYSGDCQMTIHDSKIVLAYKYTDLLEIYSSEGELLRRNFGPVNVPPSTAVMDLGNGATMGSGGPDAIRAFTSPNIGNHSIMTLFNGKLMTDNYHTNQVYVFDINGNPDRILKLDKGIFAFTVDWEKQFIYGITHEPEPAILKFEFNL